MLKMIGVSFVLALQNIRANFLHTVLSVLGIVIGVAALVAILSFIDGIEQFAKEQISSTTSLHAITIQTNTHKWLDGVQVARQEVAYFTAEKVQALEASLDNPATGYLFLEQPQELYLPDSGKNIGIVVTGVNAAVAPDITLKTGRLFNKQDIAQKKEVTLLNDKLATLITGKQDPAAALGRMVQLAGKTLRVVGVVESEEGDRARAAIPISLMGEAAFKAKPPFVIFEAREVEHVSAIQQDIAAWVKSNLSAEEDAFRIVTNEYRLEQVEKGFLLFKIVMGLISGIAVLVGGIGIMNVLLISVNERTVEIGIRKATGAKKRDIVMLFLSESVTVAGFGSLLGVGLGVLGTMVAVPIIQHFAQAPFEAAFTLSTMILIAVLALVLGIVFGTYPAMRAAGLDPVEAIRRE